MSKLMSRMLKNTKLAGADILIDSKLFSEKEVIQTEIPAINIALSGDLDGGLRPGLLSLAAPSRHFKSNFALMMAAAYIKKHDDAIIIFYDSEFGSNESYFSAFNIGADKVLHIPITTIEELMSDLSSKLDNKNDDGIKRGDKVFILVDSIGNLSSLKEAENATANHIVADVGIRAKMLKSFYRIITPHLTLKNIPMVAVQHVYQTMEVYSRAVMSGGCLQKGTKIQMADNSLKDVDLISVGEFVKTLDGDKEVTHTWNPDTLYDGTPECYKVTFEDGTSVVCSDVHKFLVGDEWVEAQNLIVDTLSVTLSTTGMKIAKIEKVGKLPVYDISVKDAEHYVLENGVVTHNTGGMLSSDNVWIIGKSQEKDGTDLVGYNFNINIEKSRYVKEKSKIPILVTYDGGISKYSGILDMAVEAGEVIKPSNGWYNLVDKETGEIIGNKVRAKDTQSEAFLGVVLKRESFKKWVRDTYKISQVKMISDDEVDSDE